MSKNEGPKRKSHSSSSATTSCLRGGSSSEQQLNAVECSVCQAFPLPSAHSSLKSLNLNLVNDQVHKTCEQLQNPRCACFFVFFSGLRCNFVLEVATQEWWVSKSFSKSNFILKVLKKEQIATFWLLLGQNHFSKNFQTPDSQVMTSGIKLRLNPCIFKIFCKVILFLQLSCG